MLLQTLRTVTSDEDNPESDFGPGCEEILNCSETEFEFCRSAAIRPGHIVSQIPLPCCALLVQEDVLHPRDTPAFTRQEHAGTSIVEYNLLGGAAPGGLYDICMYSTVRS